MQPEQVPTFVAGVTLLAGGALVARPELATGPLGLPDQSFQMRALGVADLILVPGLHRGEPRWPWMVGRCALSVAQGTYLTGVAAGAGKPKLVKALGGVLFGLAVMDIATAIQLRP